MVGGAAPDASDRGVIARGAAILSTVRATRGRRGRDSAEASRRAAGGDRDEMAATTTVEIKSRYGLERARLSRNCSPSRLARAASSASTLSLTLLASTRCRCRSSRAVPTRGSTRCALDHRSGGGAARGLAIAVDAFCDTIGFTRDETRGACSRRQSALGPPVTACARATVRTSDWRVRAPSEWRRCPPDRLRWPLAGSGTGGDGRGGARSPLPGACLMLLAGETRLPPIDGALTRAASGWRWRPTATRGRRPRRRRRC